MLLQGRLFRDLIIEQPRLTRALGLSEMPVVSILSANQWNTMESLLKGDESRGDDR